MDYKLENCGGCNSCEIACSIKHTGSSNHSVSSMQIIPDKEVKGFKVRLFEEASNGRFPCDGCVDDDGEPLCVVYCREHDGLKEIIDQFVKEKIGEKE